MKTIFIPLFLRWLLNGLTEDVDVNGGSSTAAVIGSLNDIGGTVVSLGLGDSDSGVSWLSINRDPVIWFEDKVGLGPFHPGLRLTLHLRGEFNLAAGLGSKTSQQLGIQLDLWRLCINNKDKGQSEVHTIEDN